MDYDTIFNTSGKFATDSNFFKLGAENFVSGDTITEGFKRVLGEQVYRPLGRYDTPMYNRFAGAPLTTGYGWRERALYKSESRHYKPKADAGDAFNFVDSKGVEVDFTVNIAGWIKTTIPYELETIEGVLNRGGVGQLNSMLVDNVINTYQYAMESDIGLKLVSSIGHEQNIDFTDGIQAVKDINALALKMRGNIEHFNALTNEQNENLITRSDRLYCFIDAQVLESMRNSFASLPSPDRISEHVEFIPMIDGCPTPITTTEWDATKTDASGTTIVWDGTKPPAIDKQKPTAIMVSPDIMVYRPLVKSYNISLGHNPAGMFDNEHLVYKGALAFRPWENGIRINNGTS